MILYSSLSKLCKKWITKQISKPSFDSFKRVSMTTGQNPSDAKQRDEQLPKNPYLGSVQQCDQLILL